MENTTIDVTSLSSKGQIVIPKSVRKDLSLKAGAKLMVFSDGNNIFLKPIQEPNIKEFEYLMKKTQDWAKKVGMKKSDIGDAIKAVRKKNK